MVHLHLLFTLCHKDYLFEYYFQYLFNYLFLPFFLSSHKKLGSFWILIIFSQMDSCQDDPLFRMMSGINYNLENSNVKLGLLD